MTKNNYFNETQLVHKITEKVALVLEDATFC